MGTISPNVKVYNKHDIDIVIEKMTAACQGIINESYERYVFNTRVQQQGESINDFYSALLTLRKHCSFGELNQSLIRDRIVVGVAEPALRKRLLYEKELSLNKPLDIARSLEVTNARMQNMHPQSPTYKNYDVAYIKQKNAKHAHAPHQRKYAQPAIRSNNCWYCGKGAHTRRDCPAREATCRSVRPTLTHTTLFWVLSTI